jgi:hypothetical protein
MEVWWYGRIGYVTAERSEESGNGRIYRENGIFDESRPTDHDSRTPTYKYTK